MGTGILRGTGKYQSIPYQTTPMGRHNKGKPLMPYITALNNSLGALLAKKVLKERKSLVLTMPNTHRPRRKIILYRESMSGTHIFNLKAVLLSPASPQETNLQRGSPLIDS